MRILAVSILLYFSLYQSPVSIVVIDKPPRIKTLNQIIFDASEKYQVKPHLIKAIIYAESRFVLKARRYEYKLRDLSLKNSRSYAVWIPKEYKKDKLAYSSIGYMQVLYGTGLNMGYVGSPEGLFNRETNIDIGTRYLKFKMLKYRYQGRYISAYNGGRPLYSTNKGISFINQIYVNNVYKKYVLYRPEFTPHRIILNIQTPSIIP